MNFLQGFILFIMIIDFAGIVSVINAFPKGIESLIWVCMLSFCLVILYYHYEREGKNASE